MPLTQLSSYTAGTDQMFLYTSSDPIFNGRNAVSRLAQRTGPENECVLAMHVPWEPESMDSYESFSRFADYLVDGLYATSPPNERRAHRRRLYPVSLPEFSDVCRGRGRKPQQQALLNGGVVTRLSAEDESKSVAEASASGYVGNHYWFNHMWLRPVVRGVPTIGSLLIAIKAPIPGLLGAGVFAGTSLMDKLVIEPYGRELKNDYTKEVVNNPPEAARMVGNQFENWKKDEEVHRKRRDGLYRTVVDGFVGPVAARGTSVIRRCQSYNQAEDFMETTLNLVNL